MVDTIAAIVVTYNRKILLGQCLDGVLKQTRPVDALFIVDNCSTDGTAAFLEELSFMPYGAEVTEATPQIISSVLSKCDSSKQIKVYYFRTSENGGSAGGFHEGIRAAYDAGYDLFWLMDDDGVPESDCLQSLLGFKDKADFLSPLVADRVSKNRLSFEMHLGKEKKEIWTIEQACDVAVDGLIEGWAAPFNGILITRRLISSIGNVKREMFIWGDETEFFFRALANGFKVATVTSAIHWHPRGRMRVEKVFFGKHKVGYDLDDLKRYCFLRNQGYILWSYRRNYLFRFFFKYAWFFVFSRRLDMKGMSFFFNAVRHGITEKWGREKRFLKNLP